MSNPILSETWCLIRLTPFVFKYKRVKKADHNLRLQQAPLIVFGMRHLSSTSGPVCSFIMIEQRSSNYKWIYNHDYISFILSRHFQYGIVTWNGKEWKDQVIYTPLNFVLFLERIPSSRGSNFCSLSLPSQKRNILEKIIPHRPLDSMPCYEILIHQCWGPFKFVFSLS